MVEVCHKSEVDWLSLIQGQAPPVLLKFEEIENKNTNQLVQPFEKIGE
ncbi:hypothetical protein [Neobacillus novalis]|nr:hypothetical protein [Neobacillus novalis]